VLLLPLSIFSFSQNSNAISIQCTKQIDSIHYEEVTLDATSRPIQYILEKNLPAFMSYFAQSGYISIAIRNDSILFNNASFFNKRHLRKLKKHVDRRVECFPNIRNEYLSDYTNSQSFMITEDQFLDLLLKKYMREAVGK
jgi:hypothetical protein